MTREEAQALFDYDGADLRWRRGRNVGAIAGAVHKKLGYRMIFIRGKYQRSYYAHRLIWLWVYGEWPSEIDHVNLNKADNRLTNLRLATKPENLANRRTWSKAGFKGVWQHGKNWAASIRKNKVTHHLGTYPTPELAHAAYREAATSMHGEFARST